MTKDKTNKDDVNPDYPDARQDDEVTDEDKVREGKLSAAQLPGGHGNVDQDNPDAQYPPGVVQNRANG